MYDDYFSLIKDPQMITAANVVGNAWKIAIARPDLEPDITRRLLEVPAITYLNKGEPSPECNAIVCGHVLTSLGQYVDHSKSQAQMIRFAEEQLGSRRPAVVKKAEEFLRRNKGGGFHG